MSTLVIRFSSLGDVVLCGAVTGGLAPVTMLTKRAWVEVAAALPGVTDVIAWEDLQTGQAKLGRAWRRVVDLHGSLRSRRVCVGLRAPLSRVARYDLRRRGRVWFKIGAAPPTVTQRYAKAAGLPVAGRPWIARTPTQAASPPDALALVPGAHHPTKRWPLARFAEVAASWQGPILILGGPAEKHLVSTLVSRVGSRARGIAEPGFASTIAALSRSRVLVSGDTGLMHLAAALGVPVVGIFGPTSSQDGFWEPALGIAAEAPLPCRPCSLHGGDHCPFSDHRCMNEVGSDTVIRAISGLVQP